MLYFCLFLFLNIISSDGKGSSGLPKSEANRADGEAFQKKPSQEKSKSFLKYCRYIGIGSISIFSGYGVSQLPFLKRKKVLSAIAGSAIGGFLAWNVFSYLEKFFIPLGKKKEKLVVFNYICPLEFAEKFLGGEFQDQNQVTSILNGDFYNKREEFEKYRKAQFDKPEEGKVVPVLDIENAYKYYQPEAEFRFFNEKIKLRYLYDLIDTNIKNGNDVEKFIDLCFRGLVVFPEYIQGYIRKLKDEKYWQVKEAKEKTIQTISVLSAYHNYSDSCAQHQLLSENMFNGGPLTFFEAFTLAFIREKCREHIAKDIQKGSPPNEKRKLRVCFTDKFAIVVDIQPKEGDQELIIYTKVFVELKNND